MNIRLVAGAAVLAMSAASTAFALPIPYPDVGTPNPVTYTFTASSTGDIVAYFAELTGASFDEQIGLLVNGVDTGIRGLDNHSSAPGDSVDFGMVHAGDTLTFLDQILTTGNTWYSDPSLNSDGGNHVYSTSAPAGFYSWGNPAGTYVAFEDEAFPGSDYNYHDDDFVFTNVTSSVPEPAAWSLMLLGVGGIGGLMRRTSRQLTAAA